MIEFFKNIYNAVYEIPRFYLGIEEKYCNIFTILSIIIMVGVLCYLIKIMLEVKKMRKKRKSIKRNIDKSFVSLLGDKNKNKKEKNIR